MVQNQLNNTSSSTIDIDANQLLVLIMFGALLVVMIIGFMLSKVFKAPKIHSKFARKNSFGTLNTVVATKTNK